MNSRFKSAIFLLLFSRVTRLILSYFYRTNPYTLLNESQLIFVTQKDKKIIIFFNQDTHLKSLLLLSYQENPDNKARFTYSKQKSE